MKKHIALLLLVCSGMATTAFAADPDLGPGEGFTTKFDARDLMAATDFNARNVEIAAIVKSNAKFDENVVLINQISDAAHSSFAFVDQAGGKGNFVAITQDARNSSAVAVVLQSGSNNRAVVNQH